jgi:peptidoglycan/LPS O-acetylase OafA/YrhL
MGKISYSIYIVHFFFVDHLVKSELLPALQNMHIRPTTTLATLILIGLTLSAAVATITYRLIEKPFIVYGHKIATKF